MELTENENKKWVTPNGSEVAVKFLTIRYESDDSFAIDTDYKKTIPVGEGEPDAVVNKRILKDANCVGSIERGAVTKEQVEEALRVLRAYSFDVIQNDMFPQSEAQAANA